ncbi:MAG: hypothetical protein LBE11_07225 [Prevotellaceae bacterium]|jgi:hypothetical protein|nr:hypothetical protein [Prevotellaceae bacterium]
MKKTIKKLCIAIFLFGTINYAYAQTTPKDIYLGLGAGFDYGGIGGKIEYLPTKNFGLFGGLGHNMLSIGWNAGVTYKIMPDKKASPNLMIFYGYNSTYTGEDSYSEKYNMTSYGFTFGINVDIKTKSGNKWSFGLFFPIRSSKFNRNYDAAKDDPEVNHLFESDMPVGISAGYNFKL